MDCASYEHLSLPPGQFAQAPEMGHFNNAHHFVVKNLNMYDVTPNIHARMGSEMLQVLTDHIMEGAEFDSSERDPPPRCHPGTRQDIIQDVLTWRRNSSRTKRILWLNGPAGVGKSAIIQTLAELESESPENMLGATFFFSRPNKRDSPNRVLATIAYQLAVKDPSYRNYVTERIATNPRLLGKSMSIQFKLFITRPFGELMIRKGPGAWSIYIDGLDECDGENMQCQLVELISEFTSKFPGAPLNWIIASRPESHLQTLFSRGVVALSHDAIVVPGNSPQACQDVERYLRNGFIEIRNNHPNLIPSSTPWPTESQFLEIAWAASGLFIFASTVIRFIGIYSMYGNPVIRLTYVLSAIKKAKLTADLDEDPLSALDELYTQIMSTIEPSTLAVAKQILGFSICDFSGDPGSLVELANILGLEQHVVYSALQRLHSIIEVPNPQNARTTNYKILHASFTDYLKDPARSGEYAIDPTEFNTMVWRCYLRVLMQANEDSRGVNAVTLSWSDASETNLSSIVRRARLFWAPMLMFNEICSMSLRVSIPTSELLAIFDKISFSRLELYTWELGFKTLVNLLVWLRYHSPPELRNRLVTKEYQTPLAACAPILNRVRKDKNSYEIINWPSKGLIKWDMRGIWRQAPDSSGCVRMFGSKVNLNGPHESPSQEVRVAILGGWYAFIEEKEARANGSVRLYILQLAERI